jgi:sec-independent protein translocase protein TatA
MNSLFNPVIAGMIGGWEIIAILAIVLLLFGGSKLPELAKGLGKSIKEFKKASAEADEAIAESKSAAKPTDASKTDPKPPGSS